MMIDHWRLQPELLGSLLATPISALAARTRLKMNVCEMGNGGGTQLAFSAAIAPGILDTISKMSNGTRRTKESIATTANADSLDPLEASYGSPDYSNMFSS